MSALGGQNDLAGVVVRVYCPDLGGVCFVEVSNVLALQRLSGFLEVVHFLEGLLWEVPLYKLRHKTWPILHDWYLKSEPQTTQN